MASADSSPRSGLAAGIALVLVVATASFGAYVRRLGIYYDDWPSWYLHLTGGPSALVALASGQGRPLAGLLPPPPGRKPGGLPRAHGGRSPGQWRARAPAPPAPVAGFSIGSGASVGALPRLSELLDSPHPHRALDRRERLSGAALAMAGLDGGGSTRDPTEQIHPVPHERVALVGVDPAVETPAGAGPTRSLLRDRARGAARQCSRRGRGDRGRP